MNRSIRLACLAVILSISPVLLHASAVSTPIVANDNRAPAGELRDGVLTLHLEVAEGQWHPQSEDGEAFTVYAFGETGKALQNPGPIIRVPEGVEIRALVHNALPLTTIVHGLHSRPGDDKDVLKLAAGETREVRFKTGAAGSYYYWATTKGRSIPERLPDETQLAGAFIVDSPGVVPSDRVFVIGVYYKMGKDFPVRGPQVGTINGKSWPYTEQFTFRVGETVHWRWINASFLEHAMHLHGFYYHVDAIGDGEHTEAYKEAERPLVVTHLVETGETFEMMWSPDRVGRWLYHCHMMIHMSPTDWAAVRQPPQHGHGIPRLVSTESAGGTAAEYAHHGKEIEHGGMANLVLGVTVVDDDKRIKPAPWHAERKVQLAINERTGGGVPRYALEVRDMAEPPPTAAPDFPLLGPPIVLTRGQSVEIEVANRTSKTTAIHWHGIELESYYDGVAGWTGTSEQTTPAIQAGESFVARMTPPRAGTFIYHTHWHDENQLGNGMYGPLIVMAPGVRYDPAVDKVFLFSNGVFEPFGEQLLINGGPQPAQMLLNTGTKYRFRLINISGNFGRMRVSLRRNGVPVQWRMIAKDGADLPSAMAVLKIAEMPITVGETYDVEYEASAPQDLALEILLPGLKVRASQGLAFAEKRTGP